MNERNITTVKVQIRNKVELEGLDTDKAAEVALQELCALGVPDAETIVAEALRRLKAEQHKIVFLEVPTIPRRRRHVDWYGGPTANGIWSGLERYLLDVKGWDAEPTVNSIDETSSKIVSLLDNPGKPEFATRGLVVGYVQSGKTANMTAVIAKAVDANYKFVIVLAGVTDALRAQTQARIESDLIDQAHERWHRWTTVDMDFSHPPDGGFPGPHPAHRHIAVVKKNKWILQRLLTKLENTPNAVLRNIPFLIIDDECDQASVNSSRYRDEMTAINGLIRRILQTIPRNAYIGYTATPFANVLIDPAVSVDKTRPDDLYPRDFIVALPRPPQYFGPESLFGRGLLDADDDLVDGDGLDMIRIVGDEEAEHLRPKGAKDRHDFSMTITPSLHKAIRYYLLACAARIARGQGNEHSCMLVHTTVYVEPHFDAQLVIAGHLKAIKGRLRAAEPAFVRELRTLWDDEKERVNPAQFGNTVVEFAELSKHLIDVVESIDVVVENGKSDERLDFSGGRARRYLVVGGSVLARGLTIEGLVVSFFLRTSSQYDSLMQMGRWFGYRSGYEDLPRVWMTRDMRDAFRELATVEAEIRNDIEIYRERDISPLEFAVRIRQIPGMAITAKNKMLASETCDISYASEHIQTTRFKHLDKDWLRRNWTAAGTLIDEAKRQAGRPESVSRGRLFREVKVGTITRFLKDYVTHDTHQDLQAERLLAYIESQNKKAKGSLAHWNVGIIEPGGGSESQESLGSLGKVKTVRRAMLWETKDGDADIKALMSRSDVLTDCEELGSVGSKRWDDLKQQREEAIGRKPLLLLYPIEARSEPKDARRSKDGRPTRMPLNAVADVLGIGIIFPSSEVQTPVHYVRVRLPEQEFEEPELIEFEEGDIA